MLTGFEAERRLVTVLYADLVEHTPVASAIDPEEWRSILQVYFDELTRPIRHYGGTVEKFIGDAIFAVFGAPRAHGDDAERAVRAAFEMVGALARLNVWLSPKLGGPLHVRIGIATGEAVAGTVEQRDRLVTGEVTNLAARLQAHATPDAIIISSRTYRLTANLMEAESMNLTLKGFPTVMQAYLVRHFLPDGHVRDPRFTAPLVGREAELARLMKVRQRLQAAQGGIVFIIGEAGIGKTRLAVEFRAQMMAEARFLEARCHEFTQGIPYGAVVQLLQAYLGISESDHLDLGRMRLSISLERVFGTPSPDLRRIIERLLGLEGDGRTDDRTRPIRTPEVQAEVVAAIREFLTAAASMMPIVLMVEDLHWIDAASAVVLTDLFSVTDRIPLVLMGMFRPDRRSQAWDLRVTADRDYPHRDYPHRYQEIELQPLSSDETARLAEEHFTRLGIPLDARTHIVVERAEGNPFYVEEMARSLEQQGPDGGVLRDLPDTLQELLQARLDSLPPPPGRILQVASVIGRTFPLRLLEVLSDERFDLAAHLSLLQRAGFLYEQERLPEPRFVFKHPLIHEAAYSRMLRRERNELHRRLGEVLEREASGPTSHSLPMLAYHFGRSGVWDKALTYAVKAADAARALSALEEALDHYNVALKTAREHPQPDVDQSLVSHARRSRAEILSFLGRHGEARREFEALLREQSEPKGRAQMLRGIGRMHSLTADLREAQRSMEQALRLFRRHGDPEDLVGTYRDLAKILERRRQYQRALFYAQQALAIAEAHDLQLHLHDVYHVLAATYFYAANFDDALRYAHEALGVALRNHNPVELVQARNNVAHIRFFRGDFTEALAEAQEAVRLASALRLGIPLVVAQTTHAQILLAQGHTNEAATLLTSIDALVRQKGLGDRWEATVHRERAFVLIAERRWKDAQAELERAKALEEHIRSSRNLPRIHRAMAEACLGLGDYSGARRHAALVKRYERGGNLIETPAALHLLALIDRERGQLGQAAEQLEEARRLLSSRTGSPEYARVVRDLSEVVKESRERGRTPPAQRRINVSPNSGKRRAEMRDDVAVKPRGRGRP